MQKFRQDISNRLRMTLSHLIGSRIAGRILLSNLAGLVILLLGSMILNEMRASFVISKKQDLVGQAGLISDIIADAATFGQPEPRLDEALGRDTLEALSLPVTLRGKIYAADGRLIGDSYFLSDRVVVDNLPPLSSPAFFSRQIKVLSEWSVGLLNVLVEAGSGNSVRTQTFDQEFSEASQGKIAASQRFNERGQRIISVSVPIQRVSAVIGVLTLEANDIDALTRADRAALIPFIVVAILVALIMAAFLALSIAEPLNRLAADADDITVGKTQSLELSRLTRRNDEIGQLAQSVEAMTDALFDRIAANETFAADVAHELKNPLTSIRSAVETAGLVREDTKAQEELRQVIAKDVQRLDRLITDISNASRLEAEMTRATAQRVDLVQFIKDIVSAYDGIENDRNVKVQFVDATKHGVLWINIQDGPLGQVLRNLIDNARSFSPSDDQVIVSLADGGDEASQKARIMVEDNGPGIPEDKLTKIFDRFYTDRPSGTAFGRNSGLGLSIVKQIVATFMGRVEASNRESGGARFIVELPIQ